MKQSFLPLLAIVLMSVQDANAQEKKLDKLSLSGSLQSDILVPQEDAAIGTGSYDADILTNTYLDLTLSYDNFLTVGARAEYMDYPLPGFEADFKGKGIPYFYAKGRTSWGELTVGDFYEQFGSGLVLRNYEERSLGIDNSLRGARAVIRPAKGLSVKMLGGQQRRYFEHNDSWVWGADAEMTLSDWMKGLNDKGYVWTLGGSYVSKYQKDPKNAVVDNETGDFYYDRRPEYVPAFDVRTQIQKSGFNILAEAAWKVNDPSFDNEYSYKNGSAYMLSASYSKKGMSALVQAKRSENMSYRSDRGMIGTSSFINHLPAFAYQHTYALPALYPYATQPMGEWAFQGEFSYTFARKTAIGGKYGTTFKLNASHVRAIEKVADVDDTYYQDINIAMDKKWNKSFKTNTMLMYQRYNKSKVEGHGGMIDSYIGVFEGQYKINNKFTLRGEGQYLHTKQDEGDWAFALLELSINPKFMFTVSDQWNLGETDIHYYQLSGTFTHHAHRVQAGYVRTRAGYNCSGGVCRYVPASRGFQVSYNYSF